MNRREENGPEPEAAAEAGGRRSGEVDRVSLESETVQFDYIKSSDFRVVYADGAHGGITPRGLLQMNFFSERHPIPRQTTHPLMNDRLGPEIRELRVTRPGIVREVSVGVVMTPSTARSLATWLNEKATEMAADEKNDEADREA